LEAA
jgi:hypothetical protein